MKLFSHQRIPSLFSAIGHETASLIGITFLTLMLLIKVMVHAKVMTKLVSNDLF